MATDVAAEDAWVDLEPFFFDEEAAVAEHAAGEEKRKMEARAKAVQVQVQLERIKAEKAALKRIREKYPKLGRTCYTKVHFVDLATFDFEEESPLEPMRDAGSSIEVHGTVCKDIAEQRLFAPCNSANVFSIKVVSSDVGYPINVYGTVIARDSIDGFKALYLFRRDRDNCQLIKSKDVSLIMIGPRRGHSLVDGMHFEIDLKIKCDRGQKDKQLGKGLLSLGGLYASPRKKKVEWIYLDSYFSKVAVAFGVVSWAVEATLAIEVVQGKFSGEITARTTTTRDSILLHGSKVTDAITGDGKGVAIQLLRRIVAVSLKEKLMVTIADRTGVGRTRSTIKFAPRASGSDKSEVMCGSIKMLVKVTWSVVLRHYFG